MESLNRRCVLRGLAATGSFGLALGLGACTVESDGRPRYARRPDYYYDYYYYPHLDVYFHVFSGDYYYRRDGRWLRARSLPRDRWVDGHYRVKLRIDDDVPYRRHREHFARHGMPGQWERDRDRNRSQWEKRDREERQHNIDRHIEYHRKD